MSLLLLGVVVILIGEVIGKTTPKEFSFKIYQDAKTHDFVSVKLPDNKWVLCYIENIENLPDGEVVGNCRVIGYREKNILVTPKIPIKPGTLVYKANDSLLKEIFNFDNNGIYVGILENNQEVKVYLDIESLLSKHLAVLATTGSGKSYAVGVIVEELADKNIPVVIIDPHGEYSSMRYENDNPKDKQLMDFFEVQPKGYEIMEFSPDVKINLNAKPLRFEDKNLSPQEIIQMLPTKPTPSQIGLIYSAIKDLKDRKKEYTLEDIINEISNMESNAKWNIINMMDVIKSTGLFSKNAIKIVDLVKRGKITIINLRGVSIDIQQLVVQRIVSEIFEQRKLGKIPPLLLVIEEAHNYVPEREVTYASKIIRNVASEGRKFGLGLCVVTQRPARIDKNILSQCNTQIILRVTNPNDLKAITYAEHSFTDLDKEIRNLSVGSAVLLGMEVPLFIRVRVRRSKHGGEAPSLQLDIDKYVEIIKPINYISEIPKEHETLLYPFYYVVLNTGSAYLIDSIKGKQIYFKDNKLLEVDPLDLEKNVFIDVGLKEKIGQVIQPKISKKLLENQLGDIIKSIKLVYYPYYIKDNEIVDGVMGTVKRKEE